LTLIDLAALSQIPSFPVSKRVISQPLPVDIRDWSFRGLDCQGWDFSGRDIRGCDFRNAKLNGANFSRAIAGRSKKQLKRNTIIIFGLAFGFGFALLFVHEAPYANTSTRIYASLSAIISASAFAGTGGLVAIVGAFTGVVSARNAIDSLAKGEVIVGLALSLLTLAMFILAFLSSRVAAAKKFKGSTGTDFSDATLRFADFSDAVLNNCKFDGAEINYVNWKNVTGVRSPIDTTYHLMELLISRKGTNGIYRNLDLRERNLYDIDLMKANLKGTDLTDSNLQKTDLRFANLSYVKAGGTDFSHAKLTGACIQNWTINSDTKFDGIECEHIYLTPDQKPEDRRPLSGTFEPGDFQLLLDKFADTLDFILRRGTDPVAFRQALDQFQRDNPEARIKAMVDLDLDRVLVQAIVSDTTDKVQAFEQFQTQLQLANQEIRYLKGVEEGRQRTHAETQNNLSMMQRFIQSSTINIQNIVGTNPQGNTMTDKSTQYQTGNNANIAIGGSAINSGTGAAAAGDISGNLNITLSDLAATEDPKNKELATLLDQIKKTIESPDCELDDRYKKRALEYLDNLANLAKEKPESRIEQAKNNLEDLADVADKGSKIATFAEKCFPTFMIAIGALKLWFGIP
jgi:uncharacterized protein YjbI with pentapeptide repeats